MTMSMAQLVVTAVLVEGRSKTPTPAPSAVTMTFGRVVVGCTSKVPLHQVRTSPQ